MTRTRRLPPEAPPPSGGAKIDAAALYSVLDVIGEVIYAADANWRMSLFNRAAERYFGWSRAGVLGRNFWDVFRMGLGWEYETACKRAMDAGETSTIEMVSIRYPDKTIEMRISPMEGGGIVVAQNDLTKQRDAEDALREERDRNRDILESISDCFYCVDHDWLFIYVNREAEKWWGRARDSLLGHSVWSVFPQAVGSDAHEAHLLAARTRAVVRLETISPITRRWVDLSIFPSATGLSVYFRDIGERKKAEQRQRLLVNELNHRVKNSLAVVQAIARQTLRDGSDIGPAREAFMSRLIALAAAHDVITQEHWAGADLEELIDQALRAQLDKPERLEIVGAPVTVPPKVALSLSLALHELLTNALKYGALSTPDGRIELSWSKIEAHDVRRLHVRWVERGGPPVTPPQHKGFGSRLIERSLAADLGGKVTLAFEPAGVVCDIEANLTTAEPKEPQP